jgi:hypothetical protein
MLVYQAAKRAKTSSKQFALTVVHRSLLSTDGPLFSLFSMTSTRSHPVINKNQDQIECFYAGFGSEVFQFWATDFQCTLWLFNIAMENGPFIDDFPS